MASSVTRDKIRLHPKELMLWLYLATTAMLFAGFSSAYLVQRFSEYWKSFPVPFIFWINTVVLLLSSVSLYWAQQGFRNQNPWQLQIGLMATLSLGVIFLAGQVAGWQVLVRQGLFLAGNHKAISYFYVFTGLHAAHLVAGLIVMGYWTYKALRYQVSSQSWLGLRLASIFWHGLDVLWVYLIVFLQLNQIL
ncbi:MAG: cytochrome c oxidase subunit 3 [Bacteroidia bacterium]|nr:cytochrome c oxidase subunit 3 [Bacteroidia bacterium]MCX7652183.1 cytochrome c oxidase subunit 3 [Bacteroidia bacterium]MDW8416445.1 cytochrome c oxidase subunit 3 [Bacteroidia bacterium]